MDAAVLEKIEKMMELQARAATPGEAEAAAAGITRILTKFNLEMAEVARRIGQKAPKSPYVLQHFELMKADGWMRSLADVIARANFCHLHYIPNSNRVGIVGEEANIEVVKRLVTALCPQIEAQGRAPRVGAATGPVRATDHPSTSAPVRSRVRDRVKGRGSDPPPLFCREESEHVVHQSVAALGDVGREGDQDGGDAVLGSPAGGDRGADRDPRDQE